MIRTAIAFFILGLVAILLGANGFGGFSLAVGKTIFVVFIILSILSYFANFLIVKQKRIKREVKNEKNYKKG